MAEISTNLITVAPTLEGIVGGPAARHRACRRLRGARPRRRGSLEPRLGDSFDDGLVARIEELLGLG